LVDAGESRVDPTLERVESRVHPGAESVDPGAEVEQAAEGSGGEKADRGPYGSFHPNEHRLLNGTVTNLTG
jgi:hypothetical protein